MKKAVYLLALCVILVAPGIACAQSPGSFQTEGRFFGGKENLNYLGLSFSGNSSELYSWKVGAVFSKNATYVGPVNINHGGADYEFMGFYKSQTMPAEFGLGLSLPNTADRGLVPAMSYRASYTLAKCDAGNVSITSFGIALPNPVALLGLSGEYKQGPLEWKLSLATPIAGNNSVDTTNGNRIRVGVYDAGVKWRGGNTTLGLGVTNELGWTTGMMSTPALGGQPGLKISYKVNF